MDIKLVPLKSKIIKIIEINGKKVVITDFDVKEYGNGDINKAIDAIKNNLKNMGVI